MIFSKQEQDKLRQLTVSAVILFGSRAQETQTEKSDFDIGILVSDTKILFNHEERKNLYDALYELLSPIIETVATIDVVFLQTAPAELQAHVMKYGKALFEIAPNIFANYKARVMLLYADFAPLRAIFHRGVLSQIK